ncbi:protein late bloomer [Drosophila tropicalis]|uniref:protein late bloomer n=1 Tax=Drosophila tropicalis TaxID=46794 RepID=UPI0035ABFD67
MGCTTACMKCFLNILTTLNALFGLLLIGIASMSMGQAPTTYIIYLYAFGGMLFVSSIIGCCGICRESVWLTATYGFILLVIMMVHLVSVFATIFDEEYIRKYAAEKVQSSWNLELVQPGAMNYIETMYMCCGRNEPEDHFTIKESVEWPSSCYPGNNTSLPRYGKGCTKAVTDELLVLYNYSSDTRWVSFFSTALMFICTFCLMRRFQNDRRRYRY